MLPHRHATARAAALIACTALAAVPAAAQVQVTVRPLAPPEAFFVADLLPGGSGARPDLLGITLVLSDPTTGTATRTSPATASQQAGPLISLEVEVARQSPSPAQIFQGSTAQFVLQQPVRHITLREMASRGRDVSITDFTVDDQVSQDAAGRSGRLPPGVYVFKVTVRDERGGAIDSDELSITFSSATRVELLSPGAPADQPPPVVLGPTPRFLWSGAEAPGARYRLRVVKVDDAGSAVEAVQSGFPSWDASVTGTSAFYPASAQALRLEPGATYAWQVTRELRTSGGTELVESPIYWFRLGGAGVPGGANGPLDLRFAALLRALGLSELAGFTPVGATLDDGRVIPLDKLEQLLAAIEAGEVAVLAVRVR